MKKICILDYGAGNVASVYNVIKYLGFNCKITNDRNYIKDSSHIILPGVGAYSSSVNKFKKKIDINLLENEIHNKKKPFLGICVGMQILSTLGLEFGECKGLNWIGGIVKMLNHTKLPHIGWNRIKILKKSTITKNLESGHEFYFVNSFYFEPKDKNTVVASTNYGNSFCSIIEKENIFGVQFHPEKSQKAGQILLKNFLNLNI